MLAIEAALPQANRTWPNAASSSMAAQASISRPFPSRQALSDRWNAIRPESVREALQALEVRVVVEVRRFMGLHFVIGAPADVVLEIRLARQWIGGHIGRTCRVTLVDERCVVKLEPLAYRGLAAIRTRPVLFHALQVRFQDALHHVLVLLRPVFTDDETEADAMNLEGDHVHDKPQSGLASTQCVGGREHGRLNAVRLQRR